MATNQSAGSGAIHLLAEAARRRKAGEPMQSLVLLRRAARREPLTFQIQHDHGLAALECGLVSEAVAALRGATAINPCAAKAFWRLGVALHLAGDPAAAIAAYREAVRLQPSLADAQFRLASLLDGLGHRTEAVVHYNKTLATAPQTTLGRLARARTCIIGNRDPEAERILRQALAMDANNAACNEMLANVLADRGDFEAARAHYERTIAADQRLAGSYYDLARCRRITPHDAPLITRMTQALALPGLEDGERLKLLLGLGKAADDLGNYAAAMRRFDEADALRRRMSEFDVAAYEARIDRMIAWFTPEIFARDQAGTSDATPVLVLGLPRSGTTLIEQILSSHSGVHAGGELHFWNRRGARMEQEALRQGGLAGINARELGTDYIAFLRTLAPKAARITDKMPMNFLWAGLVMLTCPSATIIHCRRSAIDTALSIHQTHFSPQLGFPTGGTELVAYIKGYRRLMAHWRRVLPADRFLEIDYEALTEAPEAWTRRMIGCAGLDWDDACLRPEDNERIIRTPSKWQARQKIHRGSVERWRRYEPYLGPLASLLSDDL